MNLFDPINTPLEGTSLIEASAGTGKTYTITALFLRLILEKQFTVDQILVVTFTKAATEELKERIRNTLVRAKSAFLNGIRDHGLFDALVKKNNNPGLAIQNIQDALTDFDSASIFTIHGFCQRILHENAFETLSPFDTELVPDPSSFTGEIVDDFWRKYFYRLPMEFISWARKKISGPEYFLNLWSKKRTPDIKIIPDLKKPTLDSLNDFKDIFKTLKTCWPISRDPVIQALKDPSLNGTIYGSLKTKSIPPAFSKRDLVVASMMTLMDRFVDDKSIGFPLFKGFEKFTANKIINSTRKNCSPPSNKIFDICDALFNKNVILESEMESFLLFLKRRFFEFAHTRLLNRKKNLNIQFYDDLLVKLKNALKDKGGTQLADTIRQEYRAALVDEFQDTDSVQYQIFTQLFTSKESSLFMIGDPKQSIYSFRGADVFSYMKAAQNVDSKYTLIENWRSKPGLITAVNTIFSYNTAPFVFKQIPFEKGVPGQPDESNSQTGSTPLILWYLSPEEISGKPKPLNKGEVVPIIASAVADEISCLISKSGNRPSIRVSDNVKPEDIAVLVRTNRQAQIIKKHLLLKGIPSVLYHTGNIFHTHEATEMERILLSIAEPTSDRRLRAALVTDIMGVPGQELDLDGKKLFSLETKYADFRKYYHLWNQYGFIKMFRMLMVQEKVRERFLAFPDGERRLTNLLQLTELLHEESVERKSGMNGLLKWLSEQRNSLTPESETHQLRLESDDSAVKIVTIHKSKGLEYPFVFYPFAWDGSIIKDHEILFHHHEQDEILTLDLGSKDIHTHLITAQNELLAENLRLFYVALTRAIKRCYVVWGLFNNAETSAMAYLLHHQPKAGNDFKNGDRVASLQRRVLAKTDKDLQDDLKQLSSRSEGTIKILPLPHDHGMKHITGEENKERLSCRYFSGRIDNSWKISSYSSLISQRTPDEELPDRDAFDDVYVPATETGLDPYKNTDIFSFPKGTRSGIFFHDIFEHLDFTAENSGHKVQLITEKLQAYGFDPRWREPVITQIDKVLSTPLVSDNTAFSLSCVKWGNRCNEMEFYFPLKSVLPRHLKKIFADHGNINLYGEFPDQLDKLSFSLTRGFIKGYMDMLFYYNGRFWLVDWKSNFLGSSMEDYGKNALKRIMNDNLYILQYHLYTLAIHQYLRWRMTDFRYEKHFGGIFYIFIRGVDPDKGPEFGIYNDFPNPDLIDAMAKSLIPGY